MHIFLSLPWVEHNVYCVSLFTTGGEVCTMCIHLDRTQYVSSTAHSLFTTGGVHIHLALPALPDRLARILDLPAAH